jgi:hypothetical protein
MLCGSSSTSNQAALVCSSGVYQEFGQCDAGSSCYALASSFAHALVCIPPGAQPPPSNDCANYNFQPFQVTPYATVGATCFDAVSIAEGPEEACGFDQSFLVCADGGYAVYQQCLPNQCGVTWRDEIGCAQAMCQ